TWSQDNNPYHVIDDVYVDNDVTLTILPGTIVKFNAAPFDNYTSIDNYFVYYNGSNTAKMLWVDGRVIANGTEEELITFTRIQDSLYYHWGIIYLREEADLCSFKYCDFKNSALMLIVLGIIPRGAISIYNEGAIIENCNFIDNLCGVFINRPVEILEVNYSNFYNIDNISPTYTYGYIAGGIKLGSISTGYFNPVLIAGNSFTETGISWGHVDINNNTPANVVDNYFLGENGVHASMESNIGSYIFDNEFINCDDGVFGGEEDNALYIKNNNFIDGRVGIDLNHGYAEISDNYFDDCRLIISHSYSSKIINNIIVNNPEPSSNPAISGNVDVITNNIINNCGVGLSGSGATQFSNNIISNNHSICSFLTDTNIIENEIIICNDEIFLHTPS
ncbi:MAG: hypothetical protein KAT74_12815, partial [Candidatus Cloacimonetes bacterium]|nr:hypothetical protein [Candidatus Cloacimonadota bacterium]